MSRLWWKVIGGASASLCDLRETSGQISGGDWSGSGSSSGPDVLQNKVAFISASETDVPYLTQWFWSLMELHLVLMGWLVLPGDASLQFPVELDWRRENLHLGSAAVRGPVHSAVVLSLWLKKYEIKFKLSERLSGSEPDGSDPAADFFFYRIIVMFF